MSANVQFKYELILRLGKLEILDDEGLKDLDRDVAEQFFSENNCKIKH